MGLGQESDREGEVVRWEAALSAPGRVAMKCQEAPSAASAQNIGREGLHIMTASMHLVHEGCGSGHFTVGGADNDLRKALTIARHGANGSALSSSRALSVASRAGVSLNTPKISAFWDSSGLLLMGLGQESDREGEVVSWEAALSAPGRVAMKCQKVLLAAIAQNFGR